MTDHVHEPQQGARGSLPDAPMTMPVQRLESPHIGSKLAHWLSFRALRRTSGEA